MKIKANGININYRIDGPEGAPWVTMSNSLATTHRMWDPQIKAFTQQYRVLRYDKRGHGETDVTPGPYSFELLADDVLALLDALKITRTHFVGLSMGGMTGMTMALRKPSVLRTLVLCDTASRDPLGDPALWQQRIDAIKAGGSMEALVESTVARFLTPDTVKTRPAVADAVRAMVRTTPTEGYIACCQAIAKLNLTDRLSAIAIPTLVVVGAEDPATTVPMAETIHQRIAGSELAVLKQAAHLSNLEQVEAFNTAVLGFLARH
ncbi:MAG TPA: 3-oxoadipate enol-lactonase [Methylomirabilota bacterium]|nr:3-oxoadipate enol-lactonase [Methylomirabilota bacterium]